LTRRDREPLCLCSIRVLDCQCVASNDYRDTMKRIVVPYRRFPRFQDQALDERRTAVTYGLVDHALAA